MSTEMRAIVAISIPKSRRDVCLDDLMSSIRQEDPAAVFQILTSEEDTAHILTVRLSDKVVRKCAQDTQLVLLTRHAEGISLPYRDDYASLFAEHRASRDIFSSGERLMLSCRILLRLPITRPDRSAGHAFTLGDMEAKGALHVVPLHDQAELRQLRRAWLQGEETVSGLESRARASTIPSTPISSTRRVHLWCSSAYSFTASLLAGQQPLDEIRDYFGESITFYFAFEAMYTRWLLVPGLFGLAVWLWNVFGVHFYVNMGLPHAEGRHNSSTVGYVVPATIALALVLSTWTSLFLKAWRRHQVSLAFSWATLGHHSVESIRPGFFGGTTVFHPVTGQQEPFETATASAARFLIYTVPVMTSVLACGVVALFVNEQLRHVLTEAISIASSETRVAANSRKSIAENLPYIARSFGLTDTSTLGKLFALQPSHLVPFVLSVSPSMRPHIAKLYLVNVQIVTHLLLYVGQLASEWTTEKENHRTVSAHKGTLIAKRALLSALVSFCPNLYIAFVEQDLSLLSERLLYAFLQGPIISGFFEIAVPFFKLLWASRFSPAAEAPVHPQSKKDEAAIAARVAVECGMDTYDTFDDMSEMFTQFGYVVLFTPHFPLAPLLAWVNNLVEGRADAFKLCTLQRPIPVKTPGFGAWNSAFEAIGHASVVVNAGLIGVATSHADWPPGLSAAARILLVLVAQNVILFLKSALEAQVPDMPHEVEVRVLREAILRPQVVCDEVAAVKTPATGLLSRKESASFPLTRMATVTAMDLGAASFASASIAANQARTHESASTSRGTIEVAATDGGAELMRSRSGRHRRESSNGTTRRRGV